jgi:hypothetical protein
MKAEDFAKMDNPAVAFYVLGLAEALSAMMGGCYSMRIPGEVQEHAQVLVDYFRAQLPDDGFMVTPSDWLA